MWSELRAERVAGEIAGLAGREVTTGELLQIVDELVDQVVPSDASCWSTFDPATTMVTSAFGRNVDEHSDDAVRFMELEYVTQVPGNYRELAAADSDGIMVHEVAVERSASPGLVEVSHHLAAMGLGQELRLVLRHQRAGWGGAGLMRRTGAAPFNADEHRFLRHVTPAVTTAIRASLVRSAGDVPSAPAEHGPAVVVVERAQVVEATPAATRWLEQLVASDRGHGELPAVLTAVAIAASAGRTVAQRARTATGAWLVLRGAPLGVGRGIVTIDEAGPPDVVSILSAALGLSAREIDVVVEVLRGSSTKEIAANLHVSTYTVQDHLKAVFQKAGVNSRRELIADVFFGIYAPRLGKPVGADGFFA